MTTIKALEISNDNDVHKSGKLAARGKPTCLTDIVLLLQARYNFGEIV